MTTSASHDTRVAILWDVDGPLNPCDAKPHRRPEGYTTHRLRPAGFEDRVVDGRQIKPLRVWLNPEHGPKMLALAEDLDAENWWATTWRHDANRLIAPILGLPQLSTLFVGVEFAFSDWKWPTVLAQFPGRPLIWFDDDFHQGWNRLGRETFLRQRGATPTLLRHVDGRIGLRDDDLDAARTWAASLKTVSCGDSIGPVS